MDFFRNFFLNFPNGGIPPKSVIETEKLRDPAKVFYLKHKMRDEISRIFLVFVIFSYFSYFYSSKKRDPADQQILDAGSGIQGPIIGPDWTLCPRLM